MQPLSLLARNMLVWIMGPWGHMLLQAVLQEHLPEVHLVSVLFFDELQYIDNNNMGLARV